MKEPTVFLIEDDDDTRALFKQILVNKGYNVLLAIDETDALQRVVSERAKIDLIVVYLVRKSSEQMFKVARIIREKGDLNVPLVAIAGEYDEELQGTNVRVGDNEYISYLEDGAEMFDLLSDLTNNSANKISRLKDTSSQFI